MSDVPPPTPPPPPGTPPGGGWAGEPYQPQGKGETNGLAITSLVLGIAGFFVTFLCGVGIIAWILALVFGYRAKSQIDETGGQQQGRGMAVAGIVLGWIGTGLFALGILILIIVVAADGS
jgi:hypothetical protein